LRTIGDHVRKRRLDLGLSHAEAAKQIGVDKPTLQKWELQRRTPSLIVIPAVIRFLGYIPFSVGSSLPDRLVAYRKIRGLRRKDLAAMLGVHFTTIERCETGKQQPQEGLRERVEALLASEVTTAETGYLTGSCP
jgi:DNA-binding XRE family transcriptional regulator